jgi:hypothetical protein
MNYGGPAEGDLLTASRLLVLNCFPPNFPVDFLKNFHYIFFQVGEAQLQSNEGSRVSQILLFF